MSKKLLTLIPFVAALAIIISSYLLGGFNISLAQDSAKPAPQATAAVAGVKPYQPIGVRTGVWNDGQAALWDLNLVDHFRIFGPAERLRGYSPEQPIKFSHLTHVQVNRIECQFCHWSVAKAGYAAIPEVRTCVGCHQILRGTTDEQKKEIPKIDEYYNKNQPIPWQKVHVMPDHVRFNHKRHVKAGVSCQECHGQIPEMEKVERVSSMKMGWCVTCHRDRGSSIDCWTCHK